MQREIWAEAGDPLDEIGRGSHRFTTGEDNVQIVQ